MSRRLTVEDSVRLKAIADAQISPDGELVAFVEGDWYKASGPDGPGMPRSRIAIVSADSGAEIGSTEGVRADTTPRWSPDGALLAFLSDRARDGQRQVYLLPRRIGEARRLTDVSGQIPSPRSLNPLKWFADGSKLAFLKEDSESPQARARRESGADQIEHERNPRFVRLWAVDVDTGALECISPEGLQIWEFDVSPDGTRVAAVVSDTPYEWDWYRCRLVAFPVGGGSVATLVDTARQVAKPAWSPDGARIAYLTSLWSDRGSDAGDVMVVSSSGGEPRNLTAGHEASYESIRWVPDAEAIIATANVHGGSGITRLGIGDGRVEQLWQAREWLTNLSVDGGGRLAAVIDTPSHPREAFAGEVVDGRVHWRRLSNLHPQLADVDLAPMRDIRWTAPDGTVIDGFLLTPPGSGREGPHPTVALIHGGPASAARAGFEDGHRWAQLLAAAGYAVYMPNYRGSLGRGVRFTESSIGDMGGKDWLDMLAGIDYLVENGIADPERLGICGWSYGGFTTAWAVTQTNRFKAAVMGAGISDWRSFHGRSYLHTWDAIHYANADPYDAEGPHARFSPINYIDRVRTPTLILHGELDWDVPVEQSYQFFRGLKDHGVVTELVVYPREPHGPLEYEHVKDIGTRLLDWFRRYM